MEIYGFYNALIYMNLIRNGITGISKQSILGSLAIAVLIWLALHLLQGVGLWTMAKKKNEKTAWLAFVPFGNLLLIEKLAGDAEFFGHKMKRGGMYAMIALIFAVAAACALAVCEGLLFTRYAQSIDYNAATGEIVWMNLDATGKALYDFYSVWGDLLYSVFGLAYEVLLFVLMISLLKRYAAKNYMTLSFFSCSCPLAVISLFSSFAKTGRLTLKNTAAQSTKSICAERVSTAIPTVTRTAILTEMLAETVTETRMQDRKLLRKTNRARILLANLTIKKRTLIRSRISTIIARRTRRIQIKIVLMSKIPRRKAQTTNFFKTLN